MKNFFRPYYHYYLRAMYYMGVAKGEITKPLQFWNETLLILIYLKTIGIEPGLNWTLGTYIIVFIMFVIFGKIIDLIGIVRYNARLGNERNPELMSILAKLDEIKSKL